MTVKINTKTAKAAADAAIHKAKSSDGSMSAHAVESTTAALALPSFRFKKPGLYDGQDELRARFEYIDAHCKPDEYGRLYHAGCVSKGRKYIASGLVEYKKFRALGNYPKVNWVIDGKELGKH